MMFVLIQLYYYDPNVLLNPDSNNKVTWGMLRDNVMGGVVGNADKFKNLIAGAHDENR